MSEIKNLPMPLKYCKQVVMEYKIYNEKIGYRVTYYYMPESGLWYSNIVTIKKRLKTAGMSFSEWRTKWYLGKSIYQMDFIWAMEYVNLFYIEKPKYTKLEIIMELLKDPEYECDFAITRKDLINLFYLTRKTEEEKKRSIDWSEVPERLKNKIQMFTIIVNETNPKTGEYPIRFSQTYDHLIRDRTKIPRYPSRNKEKESKENGEKYFAKAKEKYGDKFDYSQSEYIDSRTPIIIKCNTCGNVYKQFPRTHLENSIGCPFCANNKAQTKIWESRMEEIKSLISKGSDFEQLGKLYGCSGHQVGVMARKLSNIQEFRASLKEKELNFLEDLKDKINNNECLLNLTVPESFSKEYKIIFKNFEDIYQSINNYCTVTSLSEKYKVSEYILDDLLLSLDISVSDIKHKYEEEELVPKIIDLANKDYNRFMISEELNIGINVIYRLSKSYNIPIKVTSSIGECHVLNFINNNKYLFKHMSIHHLHSDIIDGYRVFVDFEIIDSRGRKIIIEYNGKQHYEYVEHFHKDIETFKRKLYRDFRVKEYCLENDILFIEIPYIFSTYDTISQFLTNTVFNDINSELIVDYKSLYKIPE